MCMELQVQCVSGQNEGVWLQIVVQYLSNFNHGSLPWHVLKDANAGVANVGVANAGVAL